MILYVAFLRVCVGNIRIEWMILIYLITKKDQRRLFPTACISYFHLYIFYRRLMRTARSGFSHALSTASLGREWMLSSSLLEEWKMKLKGWAVVEVWLSCRWLVDQRLLPWKTLRSIWRLLRCTSLPPPPCLHHSAGRNCFFYWKFSILGLHSKGEEGWKSRKKKSVLCFAARREAGCMCVLNIQTKEIKRICPSHR